jgi:hypothetical protein
LKCMAPSAALAASPLVSLSTFAASSHTTALVKAPLARRFLHVFEEFCF